MLSIGLALLCGIMEGKCPYAAARKRFAMAAMKPRTGDGPMEVTKEGRDIIMRVPVDGGGRLVVELTPAEATDLLNCLKDVVG